MAKRCGFPPVYKIERVAKMSAKRVFFGVLQKIWWFFCAIFFGFANAFSANLPSGYTELEYIESTGTQWIDTGYIPSITDTLTTVIKSPSTLPTSGVYYLYGTRDACLVNGFVIQLYKKFYLQYGDKDTGNLGALVADTDYTIVQNGPTYSVNGDSVTVSDASTPVLTRPLYLFTANDGGEVHASKSSFRLYSFTAKGSDSSYKINLVPAKNSSGVIGMYDLADPNPATAFHTNQGTGTFTAGPEVCPGGTLQTYTTVAASDVPAPVQNGTPTPTNPITPTFYTQGNMILRKVGDYADSYDASTGKITRRVGVKVLDGTETGWVRGTNSIYIDGSFNDAIGYSANNPAIICSHFRGGLPTITTSNMPDLSAKLGASSQPRRMYFVYDAMTTAAQFQQFLAEQHANGTPVTVYYPLATPVEENWAAEQCTSSSSPIKIATTAYNSARFSPVVTDLNTTIATIRDIVTNTINQTAAIASLQADKQTRPEDACPAGKKCLLVETEENGVIVPHWFPIIEAPEE